MTTVPAEKTDRFQLSVLAAVLVVGAEILRLLILELTRWEFGYPEVFAVRGVLFTLVYLTYAAVLVWRGRTLLRRLAAPLILLPAWLVDVFWLVAGFLDARNSIELPTGEWWLWVTRFLTVAAAVCLVAAWGVARRRGFWWLIGLLVPVVLTLVWFKWAWRIYPALPSGPLAVDLFTTVLTVAVPLLGCLVCWGIEAVSRRSA